MLWNGLVLSDRFIAAVDEVLLGQLEEEVSTQPDVEIDVALRSLCLSDMKIQGLVKKFDCSFFVVFLSPRDDGFEVGMIRGLGLLLTDLHQELKLLSCILKLVLLDLAIDHSVQWCLISLIIRGSFLVYLIGSCVLSKHALLVSDFRMEIGILWLERNSLVEHPQSPCKNDISSSAVPSKKFRHVVEKLGISSFVELHGVDKLIKFLLDIINIVFSG